MQKANTFKPPPPPAPTPPSPKKKRQKERKKEEDAGRVCLTLSSLRQFQSEGKQQHLNNTDNTLANYRFCGRPDHYRGNNYIWHQLVKSATDGTASLSPFPEDGRSIPRIEQDGGFPFIHLW